MSRVWTVRGHLAAVPPTSPFPTAALGLTLWPLPRDQPPMKGATWGVASLREPGASAPSLAQLSLPPGGTHLCISPPAQSTVATPLDSSPQLDLHQGEGTVSSSCKEEPRFGQMPPTLPTVSLSLPRSTHCGPCHSPQPGYLLLLALLCLLSQEMKQVSLAFSHLWSAPWHRLSLAPCSCFPPSHCCGGLTPAPGYARPLQLALEAHLGNSLPQGAWSSAVPLV